MIMNNHKLIMESWRKFLKESKSAVTEVDGRPIYLFYFNTWRDNFTIILYTVTEENKENISKGIELQDNFEILGSIQIVNTEDPCIPKTQQVGTIFRNSKYSGQGLGPLLYDLAFSVAHSQGYALTSDRETGSKKSARKRWAKIEADPNYEKQRTAAGNDTFDYDKSTPDPDDDCTYDDLLDRNATDHSFIKKDIDEDYSTLMKLEANHMDLMDIIQQNLGENEKQNFQSFLRMAATNMFTDEYDLAED